MPNFGSLLLLQENNRGLNIDLSSSKNRREKLRFVCRDCGLFRDVTKRYAAENSLNCKKCQSWSSPCAKLLKANLLSTEDFSTIDYLSLETNLKVLCNLCGKVAKRTYSAFEKTFQNFGHFCAICHPIGGVKTGELLRENYPHVVDRLVDKTDVESVDVFVATSKKYMFSYSCGHNCFVRPLHMISANSLCPSCQAEKKKRIESKENFVCEKCSRTSSVSIGTARARERKGLPNLCRECAVGRTDFIDFDKIATDRGIYFSDKNTNDKHRITSGSVLECDKGHQWDCYAYSIASSCPRCYSPRSAKEEEVSFFLESQGIKVIASDRSVIHPYEIDILLPDQKIAIEFNGLFWHKGGNKDRHKIKFDMCRKAGYQLVTIWEDDWNHKKKIVQEMLLRKVGVSKELKIDARKCHVLKQVDVYQKNVFFDNRHIQGTAKSSFCYALEHQGSIVAAMSFLKSNGELVLNRYATSGLVRGGFSKLLSAFEKDHPEIPSITSFSDNCVSDGGLYANHQFKNVKNIGPDYSYVYRGKREHKFNFRKKRFKKDPVLQFDEKMTESQLAELNNLHKIWDAGKVKWERKNIHYGRY